MLGFRNNRTNLSERHPGSVKAPLDSLSSVSVVALLH